MLLFIKQINWSHLLLHPITLDFFDEFLEKEIDCNSTS